MTVTSYQTFSFCITLPHVGIFNWENILCLFFLSFPFFSSDRMTNCHDFSHTHSLLRKELMIIFDMHITVGTSSIFNEETYYSYVRTGMKGYNNSLTKILLTPTKGELNHKQNLEKGKRYVR